MKLFQKYVLAFAMSLSTLSTIAAEKDLQTNPHIREYTPADRDSINTILKETQVFSSTSTEQFDIWIQDAYDAKTNTWCGLRAVVYQEIDAIVSGVCIYSFDNPELKKDHAGYIIALAVSNDFQKKGIGKALMKHVIDDCQNHECEVIELTSGPETEAYYENMGFVCDGTTSRAGLKKYFKYLDKN